jgi:glucose-1-phosphate cytidylyltransferase
MKAVILAGGYGTRLSEETGIKPKPMVEIGDKPILWHIMKIYSHHGIHDFVICLGYKGHIIKEFFANYTLHNCDVKFDFRADKMELLKNGADPWRITLVDTGMGTMTGGRLRRVRAHIGDETFCLTYGDGVSDVDIRALIDFHKRQEALVTLTAVQPPGRFGVFSLESDQTKINTFSEKPQGDGAWVNGGFFVVEPAAIDYIDGDETVWEKQPLEKMAREGRLAAFRHKGFWQPMDSLRDKNYLESMWQQPQPPWKVWA